MLSKLTGASATAAVVSGSGLEWSGVAEVQAIDQALVELPPSQRRIIGSGAGTRSRVPGRLGSGEDPRRSRPRGASLGITWTDRPAHRPMELVRRPFFLAGWWEEVSSPQSRNPSQRGRRRPRPALWNRRYPMRDTGRLTSTAAVGLSAALLLMLAAGGEPAEEQEQQQGAIEAPATEQAPATTATDTPPTAGETTTQ
jgi:hypothetical protein